MSPPFWLHCLSLYIAYDYFSCVRHDDEEFSLPHLPILWPSTLKYLYQLVGCLSNIVPLLLLLFRVHALILMHSMSFFLSCFLVQLIRRPHHQLVGHWSLFLWLHVIPNTTCILCFCVYFPLLVVAIWCMVTSKFLIKPRIDKYIIVMYKGVNVTKINKDGLFKLGFEQDMWVSNSRVTMTIDNSQ